MARSLEDIQDEIVDRLHAGEEVDREAVLMENPEHADALRGFFELLDEIEGAPAGEAPEPTKLGDFRIVRELGRGGMGLVYVAEQVSLKRPVALKVLPPALRADPRLVARFQREAEAAGRLRHPGIVPVFSVGSAAGAPFFAMELVEGKSLEAIVKELKEGGDAGLPPAGEARIRWATETVARVADALAYAHGRGILHRDVKPGNILLEEDGTPRLTDFGLALDLHAPGLTVAGEVFGSPQYMSPEQAVRREAPIDERTDVYSLAVTLYELLTLRLPYDARTSVELLTALAAGKVVPPRKANPEIPEPLAEVLARALEKDPRSRYPGAAALAADLRAALAGAPAVSRPRRGGRKRILIGAGVAVLLLVVAAVALYGPDGGDPYELPGVYIPSDQLAVIAEGGTTNGEEILAECVRTEIRLRRVLSRSDLDAYQCLVHFGIQEAGGTRAPIVVVARWEASVNRGPFRPVGSSWMGYTTSGLPEEGMVSVTDHMIMVAPLLDEVLGESVEADSASIRHRMTVRVGRRPDGWIGPEETPLEGGTAWTWTGGPRSVLIYDEYPEDYPERISDPETDAQMRDALTPDRAEYTGVTVDDGERYLGLLLYYTGDGGPLPAACEVDVIDPESGRLVGTTSNTFEPAEDRMPGEVKRTSIMSCPVLLPAERGKEEAALLLGLDAGKIRKLRLVYRPSREVALGQPHFDRYWGGTLDVIVPLTRGEEGGLESRFR
ncbi:MAG: serine/threonine-protein kinase [Planctomycetota bacterium]